MRITILLILLVAIEASIDLPSRAARSVWFAQMKNSGDAPELNGLRLLFKGQPVDEVVTSKNIKKYSIELTGTGFLPASTVVVDSIRAFPVTAGDPPQQPTSAAFVGATSFEVRFSPDTARRLGCSLSGL